MAPHKLHPVTERNLREAARISYILRQQRGKMSVYECKKAQKAFDYPELERPILCRDIGDRDQSLRTKGSG